MIRFEIATDLLNLIESKNPRLCNINIFNELYSLYHCDAYQTYGVVDVSTLDVASITSEHWRGWDQVVSLVQLIFNFFNKISQILPFY